MSMPGILLVNREYDGLVKTFAFYGKWKVKGIEIFPCRHDPCNKREEKCSYYAQGNRYSLQLYLQLSSKS